MVDRSGSGTPRRVVAEPRLAILALVAVLVMTLSIVALLDTDDVWIVVFTVLAIVAIAAAIVIDLVRVLSDSGDDAQPLDADEVRRGA